MRRRICLCLAAAVMPVLGFAGTPPEGSGDERFGVQTHFAQGWPLGTATQVAAAGIREVRDELYWNTVESKPSHFSFPAEYEQYMAALRREGITPFVILSYENRNHDGGNTPYTDEGIAAFARYAVEVVRHYGAQIKAVEVWNEYNGSFNHGPGAEDRPANYARLLRAAYTALKRERPDLQVVAGATAGTPLPYWEKLLAAGALACADALSVHPYRYEAAPEGIERDVLRLRALEAKYAGGRPKPIWVTEIGWFVRPQRVPGDLVLDEATQAKFLVRSYALLLSAGAARVYWYLFRDHEQFTMGLVRNDAAATPRASYAAMRTMIAELRDAPFAGRDVTDPDLYSLRFARPGGGEVRVIWSLTPRRIEVSGTERIVDWRGNTLGNTGALELTDSPIFVTGNLRGLPPPTRAVVADSDADFSSEQGAAGWYYGEIIGRDGTFSPLPTFTASDWHECWVSQYPYLEMTATSQHPSVTDHQPITVVRRWISDRDGTVEIKGLFRCGTTGDGVGVRVSVDGRPRMEQLLGGGNPIAASFHFTENVRRGTVVDFATNPGRGTNIDGDSTDLNVIITKSNP